MLPKISSHELRYDLLTDSLTQEEMLKHTLELAGISEAVFLEVDQRVIP
jgi:hypothetical protein